jgi:hypothetical protein
MDPLAAPASPRPHTSASSRGADDGAPALDQEWDEVFAWSYGPRTWNLGCG